MDNHLIYLSYEPIGGCFVCGLFPQYIDRERPTEYLKCDTNDNILYMSHISHVSVFAANLLNILTEHWTNKLKFILYDSHRSAIIYTVWIIFAVCYERNKKETENIFFYVYSNWQHSVEYCERSFSLTFLFTVYVLCVFNV